ncbi:hypothetical protein BESB_027300 [Besnoitia besnoiti]|uniref:Uncharacterized protein n=1 Tax=Besnoitia besnoiti TaxID=94643 RepID=A0A2A9LZY2_BESBE|nr:uncharacterized protein BESB_027300 [Besnoitia besnoiti]PFH31295.1 hypothetical protein BESB_027300 [Besnoitia besnoiti]
MAPSLAPLPAEACLEGASPWLSPAASWASSSPLSAAPSPTGPAAPSRLPVAASLSSASVFSSSSVSSADAQPPVNARIVFSLTEDAHVLEETPESHGAREQTAEEGAGGGDARRAQRTAGAERLGCGELRAEGAQGRQGGRAQRREREEAEESQPSASRVLLGRGRELLGADDAGEACGAKRRVAVLCKRLDDGDSDADDAGEAPSDAAHHGVYVEPIAFCRDTASINDIRLLLMRAQTDPVVAQTVVYNLKARESIIEQVMSQLSALLERTMEAERERDALLRKSDYLRANAYLASASPPAPEGDELEEANDGEESSRERGTPLSRASEARQNEEDSPLSTAERAASSGGAAAAGGAAPASSPRSEKNARDAAKEEASERDAADAKDGESAQRGEEGEPSCAAAPPQEKEADLRDEELQASAQTARVSFAEWERTLHTHKEKVERLTQLMQHIQALLSGERLEGGSQAAEDACKIGEDTNAKAVRADILEVLRASCDAHRAALNDLVSAADRIRLKTRGCRAGRNKRLPSSAFGARLGFPSVAAPGACAFPCFSAHVAFPLTASGFSLSPSLCGRPPHPGNGESEESLRGCAAAPDCLAAREGAGVEAFRADSEQPSRTNSSFSAASLKDSAHAGEDARGPQPRACDGEEKETHQSTGQCGGTPAGRDDAGLSPQPQAAFLLEISRFNEQAMRMNRAFHAPAHRRAGGASRRDFRSFAASSCGSFACPVAPPFSASPAFPPTFGGRGASGGLRRFSAASHAPPAPPPPPPSGAASCALVHRAERPLPPTAGASPGSTASAPFLPRPFAPLETAAPQPHIPPPPAFPPPPRSGGASFPRCPPLPQAQAHAGRARASQLAQQPSHRSRADRRALPERPTPVSLRAAGGGARGAGSQAPCAGSAQARRDASACAEERPSGVRLAASSSPAPPASKAAADAAQALLEEDQLLLLLLDSQRCAAGEDASQPASRGERGVFAPASAPLPAVLTSVPCVRMLGAAQQKGCVRDATRETPAPALACFRLGGDARGEGSRFDAFAHAEAAPAAVFGQLAGGGGDASNGFERDAN